MDPIRLMLLMGRNFSVQKMARLGTPRFGPLMF